MNSVARRRTTRRATLLAGVLAATAVSAGAQGPQPGDWFFGTDTAVEMRVPEVITRSQEFEQLEYDGPPYRGLMADLNGDGVAEYIVQSAPSLCGNGGCLYLVFDGASRRPLGQLFGGALYVRAARRNGFAVINAYSHMSAESASYATFLYDGRHYVMTSTVEMSGRALDQLTANLKRVPQGPPGRSAR